MTISKVSNTDSYLKQGDNTGLFSKKQLPAGILSFTDFCKENGINSGIADCDIRMTNYKKAQALYNEYLKENNVEIQNPLSKIEELGFGTKGFDPRSIYC